MEPFEIVVLFLRAQLKKFSYSRHALQRAGERGKDKRLPREWKGQVRLVRVHELNARTGGVKTKLRVGPWEFIAEVHPDGRARVITALGVREKT